MKFDRAYLLLTEDAAKRKGYVKSIFGKKFTLAQIDKMADTDPTVEKSYLPWIARMAALDDPSARIKEEDYEKAKEILAYFEAAKRGKIEGAPKISGEEADINRYRSLASVSAFLSKIKKAASSAGTINAAINAGMERIAGDDEYNVYKITNPESAVICSKDNAWCTKKHSVAQDYLKTGPLFVVEKDGALYALIHPKTFQAKDVNDHPLGSKGAALKKFSHAMGITNYAKELKYLKPDIDKGALTKMSMEQAAKSSPDVASAWIYAHANAMPSKSILAKAAKDGDVKDALDLLIDAVSRGVDPNDLPKTLTNRAFGSNDSVRIKNAVRQTGKRFEKFESSMTDVDLSIYLNALYDAKGDWKPVEKEFFQRCLKDEDLEIYLLVSWYKKTGRLPENIVQKIIESGSSHAASEYVHNVAKKPVPELEDLIGNNVYTAGDYAKKFGGRYEHFEDSISKSAYTSAHYAVHNLKKPWPEIEQKIVDALLFPGGKSDDIADYVKMVSDQEGESGIARLEKMVMGKEKTPNKLPQKKLKALKFIQHYGRSGVQHLATEKAYKLYRPTSAAAAEKFLKDHNAEKAWGVISSEKNAEDDCVIVTKDNAVVAVITLSKAISADGDNLSTALARSLMPMVHKSAPDLSSGYLTQISRIKDYVTEEEISKLNDPKIAYQWALKQTAPISTRTQNIASKYSVPRYDRWREAPDFFKLVIHLVNDAGMKPDDIAPSLMKKAFYPLETKLIDFASKTGLRAKKYESGLSRQNWHDYIGHLKDSAEKKDAIDDMLDVDKHGVAPVVHTIQKLGVKEPSDLKEKAAQKPFNALAYATQVLGKKPFPEGENTIYSDPGSAYQYAFDVVGANDRAKNAIAGTSYAAPYAVNVMKAPWPDEEKDILKGDSSHLYDYLVLVNHVEGDKGVDRLKKTASELYDANEINSFRYDNLIQNLDRFRQR